MKGFAATLNAYVALLAVWAMSSYYFSVKISKVTAQALDFLLGWFLMRI